MTQMENVAVIISALERERQAVITDVSSESHLNDVFNRLNNTQRALSIGQISNSENFSQEIDLSSLPFMEMAVDSEAKQVGAVYIKAPGTDFVIPPGLEQFLPAIKQAIEHHIDTNSEVAKYASIAIQQGIIEPFEESKGQPIVGIHIDADLEKMSKGENVRADRYIVSDRLQTHFIDHDFNLSGNNADNALQGNDLQELVDSELRDLGDESRQFSPYEVAYFNETTPHGYANPEQATQRTMLTVVFYDEPYFHHGNPEDNPWLAEHMNDDNSVSAMATINKSL